METISIVIPEIYLLIFLVGLQFLRKKNTRKTKNDISIYKLIIRLCFFTVVSSKQYCQNT